MDIDFFFIFNKMLKFVNLRIKSVSQPNRPIYRGNVQISGASFRDIKKMVSDRTIETKFQIGDTIVVPWINPADNKEYEMPFIVAHFSENFKDENGVSRYGVGFVSKYSLPSGYMFDNMEPSNSSGNRRSYGNNRWSVSNIRQWLNKSGFNWYKPQYEYDASPDTYINYKGFLDSLPSDLINCIEPVQVSTQTVSLDESIVDITNDRFFLLSTYEMNISNSANTSNLAKNAVEGEPWQYYRNMNGNALFTSTGVVATRKVLNVVDKTTAIVYWLRSAYLSYTSAVWCIEADGSLFINSTTYQFGCVPAFVIF